ncbi:MAG TPA: hypothetical protein VL738_25460 [Dactylosporangium sp.]|nr:hypothetical protein [Dactylosporangium sp.]
MSSFTPSLWRGWEHGAADAAAELAVPTNAAAARTSTTGMRNQRLTPRVWAITAAGYNSELNA